MTLPLIYLNQYGPTPDEFEFLDNMQAYPPKTKLKPGDLVFYRRRYINPWEHDHPRIWQVRMVVSKYQLEMHDVLHTHPGIGFDQAHELLPSRERSYHEPMVYAHPFPHGNNPDSTEWFEEFELKKIPLRAPTEEWEPILDEFHAPFLGYDTSSLGASFHLDLAPDRYDCGERKGGPLSFEEKTFHAACLVGLERIMMAPEELTIGDYDRHSGLYLP